MDSGKLAGETQQTYISETDRPFREQASLAKDHTALIAAPLSSVTMLWLSVPVDKGKRIIPGLLEERR